MPALMDFCADLAEFAGAAVLLKPKQGVTSLEQLVRETKKREKQKATHEAVKEQAAQESLESPQDDDGLTGLTLPTVTADTDHPEPDASEQCLFAELAESAQPIALGGSDLLRACPAGDGSSTVADLDRRDAVRQMLVGGMLAEYCRASGNCPASTAQELLHLIVSSRDLTVASASLQAFISILGQQLPCNSLAQPASADAASAAQFDGPQRECAIDWLPGDDALLAALQQCGYRSQDTAGKAASAKSPGKTTNGGKRSSGQKRALAQSADGEQAAGSEAAAPVVARLRLLLQLIPALRSYDQEHSSGRRRGGLRQPQRLVTALLRLQLDPAGRALSVELRVAVQALLEAWPSDKEWCASLPALASEVSQLGPNHRAHLIALQAVPQHTARGGQLRAAAAALLLNRLVPAPKGKTKPAAVPDLTRIDPQAVVQSLWWQAHSKDTKKAAQASFQGDGGFDVWELDTAVRAADLLLWPDTLAIADRANAGQQQDGDVEAARYVKGAGWHTTLRTLHTELRNVAGGWQLAAIRLAGYVDCIDQRNRLVLSPLG